MPKHPFKLGTYYKYMVADRTDHPGEAVSPAQDPTMPLFLGRSQAPPVHRFVLGDHTYCVDSVLQVSHHLNPFDVPLVLVTRVGEGG